MNRLLTIALASVLVTVELTAQASPGRTVLEKMRAAYANTWYRTLTFTQKTTFYPPGAPERVQLWLESVRYTPERGVQLRIDRGELAGGNGSLATADSTWIIRAGVIAQVRDKGNEFLPWIEGVYVQPLDETERQVRAMGIDMQKMRKGTWRGRPVTVLGARSPADTTRSQAWIDDERQVVVRMIVKADSSQPLLDVMLDGYVPAGGGWLGTKVDIYFDGVLRQREEYTDWKVDVSLPDALFDPTRWMTAPHWGRRL